MPSPSRSGLAALVALPLTFALSPVYAAAPQSETSGLYADFLTSRMAVAQSDPDEAARAALAALTLDPAQPEMLNQAFVTCAFAGRPEALGLAHLLPANPLAELMIADAAIQRGEWQEAADSVRHLPSVGVMEALRPVLLAWIDQAEGQTDAALRRLDPLMRDGRFRAAAALHAAMIADLADRPLDAGRLYQQAEAAFGTLSLRQAEIIASFYARNGREGEALGLLGRAASTQLDLGMILPAVSEHLTTRPVASVADGIAEAYVASAGSLEQGNYLRRADAETATILLRYALSLRPDFDAAKLLLAEIDRSEGHPADARTLLAGVSVDSPLSGIARLHEVEILHDLGDDTTAMATLDSLAAAFPQSALPLTQKAELLRAAGRLAAAAAAYDAAIARSGDGGPSAWVVYYQRAMVHDQSGDWPAAEADLRHALTLAPDQPAVLNYLGYSWADRGENLAEAASMIARANEAEPNDAAIVDSMGWVLLKQGDIEGAIRTLERASELSPSDPTITGHLGDAYEAAGRKLEASYQWQRALALDPDPSEAAHLHLKLEGGSRQSARAQTD